MDHNLIIEFPCYCPSNLSMFLYPSVPLSLSVCQLPMLMRLARRNKKSMSWTGCTLMSLQTVRFDSIVRPNLLHYLSIPHTLTDWLSEYSNGHLFKEQLLRIKESSAHPPRAIPSLLLPGPRPIPINWQWNQYNCHINYCLSLLSN